MYKKLLYMDGMINFKVKWIGFNFHPRKIYSENICLVIHKNVSVPSVDVLHQIEWTLKIDPGKISPILTFQIVFSWHLLANKKE